MSRDPSSRTHRDPRCRDGCAALNLALAALLRGEAPLDYVDAHLPPDANGEGRAVLDRVVRREPRLANSGDVVHTPETGLLHGLCAESAETAVVDAVTMGGDADALGAVAGAVAGARFGEGAPPAGE